VDQNEIAAILLGGIIGCVAAGMAGVATRRFRSAAFARAKRQSEAAPRLASNRWSEMRTADEAVQDAAIHNMVQSEHDQAKLKQDLCIAYLIASSSALFLAFAVSAAAVTVFSAKEAFHGFQQFVGALDLAALAICAWSFRRSGELRRSWIRQRAVTEFLRGWSLSDFVLLPCALTITPRYARAEAEIRGALASDHGDILEAVTNLSERRLVELRAAFSALDHVSVNALRFYLARRPESQKRWFASSTHRIEAHRRSRSFLMLALFLLAILTAILKLALVVAEIDSLKPLEAWTEFALLIFIGLAGASSSAYLGQNQRSLGHRYDSQLRAIDLWFKRHDSVLRLALSTEDIAKGETRQIADAVVDFESVMFAELIDWIAVTRDDAMELAPV
jgi:hypothetical protein